MTRQLAPFEIEERAADALSLLNSGTLNRVFAELQQEYLDLLIQAEVGGLTAAHAHASMKGLEAVKQKLQSYVNDQKMAVRKVR